MKQFAIGVGLCGLFALAAGRVWTQQATQPPPAIKPGTPVVPGSVAPCKPPSVHSRVWGRRLLTCSRSQVRQALFAHPTADFLHVRQ